MMLDPILTRLIAERLPGGRYGVFFGCGEGDFFPDGTEESSGSVVTEDGEHYGYWTGWDATAAGVRFNKWQRLDCDGSEWADDEEYQDAREAAGLGRAGGG